MEPTINQAIILAGGRAERMRPFSDSLPKALVTVDNVALITRQLLHLEKQGITHVVVSSGHLYRQVSEYVGGGSYYRLTVRHAVDPGHALGTAGAVRFAHSALEDPSAPFLVLNGSVSTDMELAPLFERHRNARASATMALVRYTTSRPVAEESADGRIRGLPQVTKLPYWVDAGLMVLQPYAVKMLPEHGDLNNVFETIAAEGLLAAYHAPDETFWRELVTVGDVYAYPKDSRG